MPSLPLLQAILNTDPDALVATETSGQVVFANRAAYGLFSSVTLAPGSPFAPAFATEFKLPGADQQGADSKPRGISAPKLLGLLDAEPTPLLSASHSSRYDLSVTSFTDVEQGPEQLLFRFRALAAKPPMLATVPALHATEHQYGQLLNAASVGVLLVDLDGKVVADNERARTIIGAGSRHAGLKGLRLTDPPVNSTVLNKRFQEVSRTHQPAFEEAQWTTRFSKEACVRAHFLPAANDHGEVNQVLILFEDIADQRKTQNALRNTQRLESLGVVAGGVAHEFNNLLQAISGNLELAALKIEDRSSALNNLTQAQKAAAEASKLTERMLAFAGRSAKLLKKVDLNTLVADTLETIETGSKSVRLEQALSPTQLLVECDRTQLDQVVHNIVSNAIESHGDRPGLVTVSTSDVILTEYGAEQLPYGAAEPGRHHVFRVVDQGCGMDAETVDRVFDPFFSTKFMGRGLGMAAVLGIVQSHGGGVSVSSVPEQGTTIEIFLPALANPASAESDLGAQPRLVAEAAEAAEPVSVGPVGPRRVLLVEDDPSVALVARRLLERSGFQVEHAPTGELALERLDQDTCFDVVLLDLTLPGISGDVVLSELARRKIDTPVVVASGHALKEIEERTRSFDVYQYIRKPWTREQLVQALNGAVQAGSQAAAVRVRTAASSQR